MTPYKLPYTGGNGAPCSIPWLQPWLRETLRHQRMLQLSGSNLQLDVFLAGLTRIHQFNNLSVSMVHHYDSANTEVVILEHPRSHVSVLRSVTVEVSLISLVSYCFANFRAVFTPSTERMVTSDGCCGY